VEQSALSLQVLKGYTFPLFVGKEGIFISLIGDVVDVNIMNAQDLNMQVLRNSQDWWGFHTGKSASIHNQLLHFRGVIDSHGYVLME